MRSFFAEIYLYLTTKYPKKKIFGNDTQMQAKKKNQEWHNNCVYVIRKMMKNNIDYQAK